MSSRSTQTTSQNVSVGLQTDLPSSRGVALHTKAWSPRPSSATTSTLASARTRQISTSLDKVHGRIERPCCSPKYGSPKLQRRVSSGWSPNGSWCVLEAPQTGAAKVKSHAFDFRLHLQAGWELYLQGPQPVEPTAKNHGWEWGLGLGSLHHHQRQPCPQRSHRRPVQPLQCGGTLRKHRVALEGRWRCKDFAWQITKY